jgi:hypothetical protein
MSSVSDSEKSNDSAEPTREFFNRYFTQSISFPSNQVNAVVGFFESRGFEKTAAASISAVLLEQSKIDNINVFDLLESLKSFDKIRLTSLVTAILNANRSAVSKLGYREENVPKTFEARNILI